MADDDAAVILDLDGTLVDSVYEHVRAWKLAFQRIGVEIPAARIHRAIGMGGDRLVAAVAGDSVEHGMGDEVRDLHDQIFMEAVGEVRALPGASDLLHAIAESGRRTVLASSSPPDQVDRLLEQVADAHVLGEIVTGDDAEASKPAPEIISVAAQRIGADSAVVVGDAVWDVESAARAGLRCVGLRSGGISGDELLEAGAVAVYDDPQDLAAHLEEALNGQAASPTRTATAAG